MLNIAVLKLSSHHHNNSIHQASMAYSYLTIKLFELTFWIKIITESLVNTIKRLTFQQHPQALLPENVEDKVVMITGANRGLGLEMAKTFARLGAKVVMACRDTKAAQTALDKIEPSIDDQNGNVTLVELDLASFESIGRCARIVSQCHPRIDILVNNACIMMTHSQRSVDGIELQFATNYLGHYLLTNLLLDCLKASKQARIINLSSISHQAYIINFDNINLAGGVYSPIRGYGQSKLAMLLFTRQLAARLSSTNITSYAVHPGLVKTELYARSASWFSRASARYFGTLGMITPWQGIQTVLFCALEPSLVNESGHYYYRCKRVDNLVARVNDQDAQRLWILSAQLCGAQV